MEEDFGATLKRMDSEQIGEFQVRIHIIEARDLKGRDANGMADPVVIVTCLDQKKTTKTFKKTTYCTFDQLMFFEHKQTKINFFKGRISITVMDANTFSRNVEIGSYDFDIDTVYKYPNHEVYRRWVALADKKAVNTGFLKLSISVLAPGDAAVAHKEEEELDDASETGQDLQSMVMLPPSISPKNHVLEVKLYKADHLPKMDTFGKCDGFTAIRYGKSQYKTSVIKNNYSPQWNEEIGLHATTPSMIDLITVQLYDWDQGSKDEIIATKFLRFSEIIERSQGVDWAIPRWIHFYGSPNDVPTLKKGLAEKMNLGEIEGIHYRGSVLLSATSKQVPDIDSWLGVKKVDVMDLKEPAQTEYILRFHLYEACQLDAKEAYVEVEFGWESVKGEKTKVANGTARWFKSFSDLKITLPRDKAQLPNIFINVYKGSDKLGFVCLDPATLSAAQNPKWEILKPDIFTGDPDQQAGFILFAAQFAPTPQIGARSEIKAPTFKKYQLRAHIYQGRDLPSGDDNGSSDPYVIVTMGTTKSKSKVIQQTCFPTWYETLVSEVELPDYPHASDVHVVVMDEDKLTKDDYLGRFSVPRSKITDQLITPQWYSIYKNNPKYTEGEILVGFQLIPIENAAQFPEVKIAPKTKDCILQINVVGLRELAPFALLPIQNSLIEFDCGQGTTVFTPTSKKPNGSNPNFLKKLELPIKVPEDPLYSPSINIRVKDDRLIKYLIATRSLSALSFVPWGNKPPVSDEDVEIRAVDSIPGAVKEEPKKEELVETKIDIPDPIPPATVDENQPLLGGQQQPVNDLRETRNQLIRNLKQKTTEVAESIPQGLEEFREEDNKRKTTDHELELEFKEPAFNVYTLHRAQKAKGLEGISKKIEVGKLKCQFKIQEASKKAEDTLQLDTLFTPRDIVVRIYILEAYNVVPTDQDGSSNPYIRISCNGKTLIKEVQTESQNVSRPIFYKCHELKLKYPDQSVLSVELWDYDKLSSDDLIGATKIDLETRIGSAEWKALKIKPIEQRALWNPVSVNPQGILKLWVDIFTPEEAAKIPKEPISPPLPQEYELRVIVWETRDVAFKDKNMSDIFVSLYPEGQDPQITDTHWRSENGKGAFNWRMKFPITLPTRVPTLKVQVWDKDILNPNDAICEANLNLRSFYRKAYTLKSSRESLSKQWLTMTHSSEPGKKMGEIELSIELLTKEEAARFKNGYGRGEPNDHPALPPPVRPETSFNPLRLDKFVGNVLWKQWRWKVYGILACCCCIIIVIIILTVKFYIF